LVFAAGCATTGGAPPAAPSFSSADSITRAPPLDQIQWGVLAVEAESGRALYARQPSTKLIPASSLKLAVAAAALHHLGADHRFETALRAAGSLDPATGVLDGDLVLVGTGDPTLSSRVWGDFGAVLRAFADSLRGAGVREVAGSLVVDATGWDSTTTVPSWMVEDLPDVATGGAFVLAEGVTTVRVEGAPEPGGSARVSWSPHGEDTFVASRLQTVATAAEAAAAPPRATYRPESRQLVLDGRLAAGSVVTLQLGTRDPVRQSAAALARALAGAEIQLRGGWRVAWTAGEALSAGCAAGGLDACGAPTVARLTSPPLSEIVAVVLGPSHNWTAEQLVRALGRLDTASAAPAAAAPAPPPPAAMPTPALPPASWATGLSVVRRYLVETVGVDSLDLRLRDGSGLSAQNVVTPRALVQLLAHARAAPWGETFRRALAEPGEGSTTLSARLRGLEGRVFAKTGSLTNVAALSGYLTREDGGLVIFSILTNGSGLPGSRVQAGIDQLVRALAGG
jgi:D-alanyl-D-alanine carboxypeptidase/D-alanyl-D-alanine-endopeptidase (penicillin-binding protein 4)